MSTLDWQDRGACRHPDVQLAMFFPHSSDLTSLKAAQDICRACPVAVQCLVWILGIETPLTRHGVYGGATPSQRKRIMERTYKKRGTVTEEARVFVARTRSETELPDAA